VLAVLLTGCPSGADAPPKSSSDEAPATKITGPHRYEIQLNLQSGDQQVSAANAASAGPRPVLEAHSGGQLSVNWVVTNPSKDKAYKDVTLHFFLVAVSKPGQVEAPPLDLVQAESALTMDFEPAARSEGHLQLQAPPAGLYQMRIETIDDAPERDQVVIDVDVK
jgi:hypothetical protein